MNLPKRDGVNGRYYLIHKPDTDPEVLKHADQCIQDVLDGKAKENHSGFPTVVRNQSGTPFLPNQLVERYLSKLPLKGFPYEEAVTFCDALRRLVGWREIGHTLGKYIKHQVQERFFEIRENEDYFSPFPLCIAWPELRPEDVDENLLRFTCYVAVCYTVYGASDNTVITEHYLDLVSQLRPDMVKQLKTAGSGKLPKDIRQRKTGHFTATANDAFATIRITAKDSTKECYAEILDYLCAVLEQETFPRSYSVDFRGKDKIYLPIPGLPKKGVNQLFACAVQYPDLHPAMERYARLAMREYEFYQNLAEEFCAMPGTFAVFALGLQGDRQDVAVRLADVCRSFIEHMVQALEAGYSMGRSVRYLKNSLMLPLTEAALKCSEHGPVKPSDMLSVYSGCVCLGYEKVNMKRFCEKLVGNGVRDYVYDSLVRCIVPEWELSEGSVFPEIKEWLVSHHGTEGGAEAETALKEISCISGNALICDALMKTVQNGKR